MNAVILKERVWIVGAAVALVAVGPIAFYVKSTPSLIAVPIVFGSILLLAMEVVLGEDKPERIQHKVEEEKWPEEPEAFVELDQGLVSEINSTIAGGQKIVLTGQRGSGKTTCAVGLCRMYERLNGHSPVKQKPVFVSLSQSRHSERIKETLFDHALNHLAIENPKTSLSHVRKMIKAGSLLFVIDDIDYLGKHDQTELQKFIFRWTKNGFFCIVSEIPSNSILFNDFTKIVMPEWEPDVVKSYIHRRIPDAKRSNLLIESLEQGGELQHSLSPWQVSFLINACLEGRYYELLSLGNTSGELDYKILDDYLKIVMTNADNNIDYLTKIREFGKLSLKLLKEGRSSFVPESEHIPMEDIKGLVPKMLLQKGDSLTFIHGNYQIFLAGRYIATFWTEAKSALRDDDARVLIWKPVYACARQFLNDSQATEVQEAFQKLGQ